MLITSLFLCTSACASLPAASGKLTTIVDVGTAWVADGTVRIRLENSTGSQICLDPNYQGVSGVSAFRDGQPAPSVRLPMITPRVECFSLPDGQAVEFVVDAKAKYPDRIGEDRVCYAVQYVKDEVFQEAEACSDAE